MSRHVPTRALAHRSRVARLLLRGSFGEHVRTDSLETAELSVFVLLYFCTSKASKASTLSTLYGEALEHAEAAHYGRVVGREIERELCPFRASVCVLLYK